MHLYIIKNVLSDYTSGMAIVAAENITQCRELFLKEVGTPYADEFDKYAQFTILNDVGIDEAGVIEYVYGGG